jgi:ABC-type multidrug transport system ATPase subunit
MSRAGMKRRLSVAISLIGSPKVVYLDEPSTGLDPAARRNLWEVVKTAKADKAVILTTHSMEEAEVLCDRLGIFVKGRLVCIGNPRQLTARYGGYYVCSLTTLGPVNIRALEIFLGYASPCLMDLFSPKG